MLKRMISVARLLVKVRVEVTKMERTSRNMQREVDEFVQEWDGVKGVVTECISDMKRGCATTTQITLATRSMRAINDRRITLEALSQQQRIATEQLLSRVRAMRVPGSDRHPLYGLVRLADFFGLETRAAIKALAGDYDAEIRRLRSEGRVVAARWNEWLAWGCAIRYVFRGALEQLLRYFVKSLGGTD
jgi:hypothetical protein